MATLFGRRLSLFVGVGGSGLELAPDPTNMPKATFKIRQFDFQTPNSAVIRVWNLAPNTVQRITKEFTRVVLQAGYVNANFGVIFQGTIIQTRKGNESAVDSYVDIIGADGDEAQAFAVVNTAIAKGSTFQDRINAIAKAMAPHGVTVGQVSGLPSTQLPRGKTMFGMARDHLRDLAFSTDTKWSIQNGQLQVFPVTGYPPGDLVVLTSATGLLGFPEQTEEGIVIRCLLDPRIRPGTRVQIDNKSVQQAQLQFSRTNAAVQANALLPSFADDGIYRVVVCEPEGDTRGEAWWCKLICIALNQPLTPGLIAKGYS